MRHLILGQFELILERLQLRLHRRCLQVHLDSLILGDGLLVLAVVSLVLKQAKGGFHCFKPALSQVGVSLLCGHFFTNDSRYAVFLTTKLDEPIHFGLQLRDFVRVFARFLHVIQAVDLGLLEHLHVLPVSSEEFLQALLGLHAESQAFLIVMLQDGVRLMQALERFLFLEDILLKCHDLFLQIFDLLLEPLYYLLFGQDSVVHILLLLDFLHFVGVRHFVDQHFPLVLIAALQELLVHPHDCCKEVLLVLAVLDAVGDDAVEADCVHVERLLEPVRQVWRQPILGQALVVKSILDRSFLTVFDFLCSVRQARVLVCRIGLRCIGFGLSQSFCFRWALMVEGQLGDRTFFLRQHGVVPFFDDPGGHVQGFHAVLEAVHALEPAMSCLESDLIVGADDEVGVREVDPWAELGLICIPID